MTPEQKAATERLHESIIEAGRAFEYDDEYMITDWVVLTAETRFDEHGTQFTAYGKLYMNGSMPDYRVLGLLELHRELIRDGLFNREAGDGD